MHARFSLALAALLAAPALTAFAQPSNCDGRFIDGFGFPGTSPANSGIINALTEWDPDGPGPAKPLLIVGTTNNDAMGYTFGRGIYAYDGVSWRSLGRGLQGSNTARGVRALAVYKGELYAAGDFQVEAGFTTQLNGLARWDGGAWQPVVNNPSTTGFQSLFVYNNELLASAPDSQTLTIGSTNIGGAARFDGQQWHAFGSSPAPTSISTFGTFQGDLYIGGLFSSAGTATASNIARWDGTNWQPLDGTPIPGTNARVHALQEFQGLLYVGGDFSQAGEQHAAGVATWNGSAWGGEDVAAKVIGVYTFLVHDSKLIVGGKFGYIGGTGTSLLAAWDGSNWSTVSYDVAGIPPNNYVRTLAQFNGKPYAGGFFRTSSWEDREIYGLSSLAQIPMNPQQNLQRPTQIDGSVVAGFATLNDDLYSYGIFSVSSYNIEQPSLAKRVNGEWQKFGGLLGGAYNPGSDTMIGRLRDTARFNNELVFVGTFSSVDNVEAHCVAAFNGTSWHSVLPAGLLPGATGIHSTTVFENSLILAGRFDNATTTDGAATNIVRWDGSQLHSMGTIPETVYVVRSFQGVLYAGTDNNAYRWSGSQWLAMRSASDVGITGVTSFANFKGRLIAGTSNQTYEWNGSEWLSLNGPGPVNSLVEYRDELFAVGFFAKSGFNAARWKGTGQWIPLGTGPDNSTPNRSSTLASLTCAIVFDGELNLGGLHGFYFNRSYTFNLPLALVYSRYTTDTLPRFEGEPTNQIFTLNHEARLQASLQAGAERPSIVSFQWQRNGVPIANGAAGASPGGGTVQGATSATLHIFGVQPSDAGNYNLIATSSCGTQTSESGELKVRLIPQDINADGFVNDADFELFVQQYDVMVCDDPSMPDGCSADFNADGIVDDADFALFIPAYEALFADGR